MGFDAVFFRDQAARVAPGPGSPWTRNTFFKPLAKGRIHSINSCWSRGRRVPLANYFGAQRHRLAENGYLLLMVLNLAA